MTPTRHKHSSPAPLDPPTSITFWGVRGSLAAPGERTRRIGGNTSSVEVRHGQTSLLFDAGTGIRACGEALAREPGRELHLLFSHLHWDHIQGFPFFLPAYAPGRKLAVHGPCDVDALRGTLETQMGAPNFPVRFADLRADIQLHSVTPDLTRRLGGLDVRAARLNHPGGVSAYRVDSEAGAVVYSTDHEHGTAADERLTDLARGADVPFASTRRTPFAECSRCSTRRTARSCRRTWTTSARSRGSWPTPFGSQAGS